MSHILTSIQTPYYDSTITSDYFSSRTVGDSQKNIRDHIADKVSTMIGVRMKLVKGLSRIRPVVHTRQIIAILLREKTTMSLDEIGEFLGGRDHSTIIHAVKLESTLRMEYPDIFKYFDTWTH